MHMWYLRKGTNIMMVTNSLTGTGSLQPNLPGMNVKMDSVSKNIQNQIANAQKKLQELSSNTEMGVEEKMKKRQEIQQEITSLQQQLRQHQITQRKEQQKDVSMDDMLPGRRRDKDTGKAGSKGNGLSQEGMQAMISADSSIKQTKVQGSTASKLEGRAGILEAEIKQDTGKTGVEKKQEELAALQQKAMAASAAQMSSLAEAEKAAGEAGKAEQAADSTDNKEDKDNKTDKVQAEEAEPHENVNPAGPVQAENIQEAAMAGVKPVAYVPVDISL